MPPIAAIFTPTRRRLRRLFSTHAPPSTSLHHLSHPIYMIWGANTGVGKTLVSAALSAASLLSLSPPLSRFIYLKPLQTGFPVDSDAQFVFRKFSQIFLHRRPKRSVFASNYMIRASNSAYGEVLGGGFGNSGRGFGDLGEKSAFEAGLGCGFRDLAVYEERKLQGRGSDVTDESSELICRTIYGWREAVSPHLAAEREGAVVKDSVLLDVLKRSLEIGLEEGDNKHSIMTVIETAGGVASPGPSGSLQCDLYRSFLNMLPGLCGYRLYLLVMGGLVESHQLSQLTKV